MLKFSCSILGFNVNDKLQKQTFSTQNKSKTISITEHPKQNHNSNYLKLSVRLKDSGISNLLAPTTPTGKITGISLNRNGEWFRIPEQYGFHTFLLQYKNKVYLSRFSKQCYWVREIINFTGGGRLIGWWASQEDWFWSFKLVEAKFNVL